MKADKSKIIFESLIENNFSDDVLNILISKFDIEKRNLIKKAKLYSANQASFEEKELFEIVYGAYLERNEKQKNENTKWKKFYKEIYEAKTDERLHEILKSPGFSLKYIRDSIIVIKEKKLSIDDLEHNEFVKNVEPKVYKIRLLNKQDLKEKRHILHKQIKAEADQRLANELLVSKMVVIGLLNDVYNTPEEYAESYNIPLDILNKHIINIKKYDSAMALRISQRFEDKCDVESKMVETIFRVKDLLKYGAFDETGKLVDFKLIDYYALCGNNIEEFFNLSKKILANNDIKYIAKFMSYNLKSPRLNFDAERLATVKIYDSKNGNDIEYNVELDQKEAVKEYLDTNGIPKLQVIYSSVLRKYVKGEFDLAKKLADNLPTLYTKNEFDEIKRKRLK